jgi:hypothetical protein
MPTPFTIRNLSLRALSSTEQRALFRFASARGGKIRTVLRFTVLARVRFYTKRSPEAGYRFLGLGSSRNALADLSRDSHQQNKHRRNPVALAHEWQRLLDTGVVPSRAALARELCVSRAHVTQVLGLLRLSPEEQQAVLGLGDPIAGRRLGVHALRSLPFLPPDE